MIRKLLFLSVVVTIMAASASAANIVTNGNFSTGNFTGWTTNTCATTCGSAGLAVDGTNFGDPGAPTDTLFGAETGCDDTTDCNDPVIGTWISQLLTTDPLQTYTLTFLFDPGDATNGVELDVLWNNALVSTGPSANPVVNPTSLEWQTYTYTGLVPAGGSTSLEFTFRDDPDFLSISDISVTGSGASSVPEPASLLLIGGGLLGMGALLRRKRNA
jgi:hypothetical protein